MMEGVYSPLFNMSLKVVIGNHSPLFSYKRLCTFVKPYDFIFIIKEKNKINKQFSVFH